MKLPRNIGEFRLDVDLEWEGLHKKVSDIVNHELRDPDIKGIKDLAREMQNANVMYVLASYDFQDGKIGGISISMLGDRPGQGDPLDLYLLIEETINKKRTVMAAWRVDEFLKSPEKEKDLLSDFISIVRQSDEEGRFWNGLPEAELEEKVGQFW